MNCLLFQFPIVRDAFDEPQTAQVARQGETDKVTDDFAMESRPFDIELSPFPGRFQTGDGKTIA
jgi:hypothetical protein